MKVAADGGDGEDAGAGQEVEERFFFDGVDVDGAGIAIDDGSQDTVEIDSDAALATLAGLNHAVFWT